MNEEESYDDKDGDIRADLRAALRELDAGDEEEWEVESIKDELRRMFNANSRM